VFEVEVPRAVALAEAPSFSKPIILYRPDSPGAQAYERLAREVIAQEVALAETVVAAAMSSKNFGNFNI
jgi:cellulose biosynthesis protein BcsQ